MIYAATFDENDTASIAALESLSRPWRLERAAHIRRPGQKLRSLAAGLLLDYALLQEGYPPIEQVTYNAGGKPLSDPVHFSLTHCRGLAACALSEMPVGIDAEPLRTFSLGLRQRVFTDDEQQAAQVSPDPDRHLTRLWTLKEAYAKATGEGIVAVLARARFRIDASRIAGPDGFDYQLIEDIEGYILALATQSK